MRKITQNSVNAFLVGNEFNQASMSVRLNSEANQWEKNDLISSLYLHGNLIATKNHVTNEIWITNAGWFSNTTKERLNAIPGVSIYQKNWIWYLNDKEWDGKLTKIK